MTEEGNRLLIDLFRIEWSNMEAYRSKYDHRINPDSYSKRARGTGGIVEDMWRKYKPVIEMYRVTDMDERAYEHWEYLADEMFKLRQPAIDRLTGRARR